MALMVPDVLEQLRTGAREAFAGRPVRFAYLFGSHAAGRPWSNSDIDIAVQLDDRVPRDQYLDLQLNLARWLALATSLGGIEVVVLNDAPLTLQGRIIETRWVIYSVDEPARVELESKVARQFADYQICFRGLEHELLARIAAGGR
jgi:uncharacterized protein